MSSLQCPKCGETSNFVNDNTVCGSCGVLVSTNKFANELEFQDNKAVGKWVYGGQLRGK